MEIKNLVLVAVATCIFLYPSDTISFRIVNNINEYHPLSNFKKGLDSASADIELKWLLKAATPSYLQDFLKLVDRNTSFETGSFQDERRQFFDTLLNGVASDSCKGHVTEWFWRWGPSNLENIGSEKEKWVLQMLDAWGKLPEGILSGHVNAHGDFDECVQVEVNDLEILNNIYPEKDIATQFEGQYCTSYILDYNTAMQITPNPVVINSKQLQSGVDNGLHRSVSLEEFLRILTSPIPVAIRMIPSVATCMPNSCSQQDVQQILVNGLHMVYSSTLDSDPTLLPWPVTISCTDKHKPSLDGAAISVIILLTILVVLALGAGIIDYWYKHSPGKEKGSATPTSNAYKYLMAFSLYSNTKKWLSTRKSPDDLGCLHGIRFLSTAWVVLAHTYLLFIQGPQWNLIDIKNIQKDWTVLAVINATFSVDTFFLMSGLLATYSILKMLDKTKGKFNVPMFYVHRYIRLTPTYAILIGIAATLVAYAGNGPNWYTLQAAEDNCRKNWWTNILYINNLVNSAEIQKHCEFVDSGALRNQVANGGLVKFLVTKFCVDEGESWYLANDMQFYILSPLIVYPIWKWELTGLFLLAVYTILSCVSQVLIVRYATDAPAAMVMTGNLRTGAGISEIYVRPWSRIAPFLAGIWLGWLLHKTRGRRIDLPRPLVLGLWLWSTGTALAVIFGIRPWFEPENEIPEVSGYFYGGLSRFSWGVAVAWVIFACVNGYGGIVNSFLSWKVFMPLGRLCFCVYLASSLLQTIFYNRLTIPIKWDVYTAVNLYFAHMVMSYFVGFLCTLIFESPFMVLQKLIFDRKSGGQKEKQGKLEVSENNNNNNNNNFENSIKVNNE